MSFANSGERGRTWLRALPRTLDTCTQPSFRPEKQKLLMPRKSVPKAKQDAFEHICGQRRTVVKQLSDRQRLPTCATEQHPG